MRRQTRSLLVLAAVALLLAVLVTLQVRRERAWRPEPLTDIDAQSVKVIEVRCNDCTTRRFERSGETWRMVAPRAAAADPAAIERLLAIAHSPIRKRFEPGALDPAKLGLAPPQAELRLDGTAIAFGTTDAIDGDRYALAGGRVALLPDRFSVTLHETADSEMAKPKP